MLVADCNDFPIGHIFIQLSSGEQHIADGRRRAYLYSLRVMDMFQGRGIGTRLIDEASKCCPRTRLSLDDHRGGKRQSARPPPV